MIEFPCSSCHQPVHAPAEWSGKRVGCRQCGAVNTVPNSSSTTEPSNDWSHTLGEIDDHAQGKTAQLDDLNDVVEVVLNEEAGNEPARRVARRAPLIIGLIIVPITIAIVGIFAARQFSPPNPVVVLPPPGPPRLAPIQPRVIESDRRRMVRDELFQAIEQGNIAPLIEALAHEHWLLQASIEWPPPAPSRLRLSAATPTHPTPPIAKQLGWTLVHHAVWFDRPAIMQVLLDANAPVDAQTDSGLTPLHIAVMRDQQPTRFDLLRTVLKHPTNPATVDLRDHNGRTALWLAIERHDLPTAKRLLSFNADASAMDTQGRSPISLAMDSRDEPTRLWGRSQALRALASRSLALLNTHATVGLTTTATPSVSSNTSRSQSRIDPFLNALEHRKRQASLASPSPNEIKTLYWQRAQFAQALAAAAKQRRETRTLTKQLNIIEQTLADGQYHHAAMLYNELADKHQYLDDSTFDRYLALEPTFRAIERQWLESASATLASGDLPGAVVELCAAAKILEPLPKIDTAQKMLTLWKGDLYFGPDLGDLTFEILDALAVADLRQALLENDRQRTLALLPTLIKKFGNPENASRVRTLMDQLDQQHLAILGLHDLDWQNQRGRTLLHEAIDIADHSLIRLLLALGIDINTPDEHRMTALHWAVIRKNATLTALLLDHQADPNATDDQNRKPLDWAIMLNQTKIAQQLRATKKSQTSVLRIHHPF